MYRQQNARVKNIAAILLIILLGIVTRLPQLLSDNLLLDSDECILALMARHMCTGKAFPIFFYGQSYGFSLAETTAISLFSLPAGMTDVAVKLAMLSFWITGVVFFYKTLKEVIAGNQYIPLLATVLLLLCPVWAVWSMKARGGYLTAFMCSNIVSWLLLKRNGSRTGYMLAGIFIAVTGFSQPLWLPGLLPLVLYAWMRQRPRLYWWYFAGGLIMALVILLVLKHHAVDYWKPEVFRMEWRFVKQVNHVWSLLTDHFNGWYYLDEISPASFASRVSAGIMMAVLIIVTAAAVFFALHNFNTNLLFICAVLSVLCTLSYALFLATDAPRYLLPLTGYLLFSLALLLEKLKDRPVLFTVCGPVAIAGCCALYSFRNYTFVPFSKKELQSSIRYLQQHDVRYVFSNDGLLEWQLMYYSGEQLICRESSLKDRLPDYVRQVNAAYHTTRQTTAVIDFYGDLPDMAPGRVAMTGGKFAVVLQPDAQLLYDMEFEF